MSSDSALPLNRASEGPFFDLSGDGLARLLPFGTLRRVPADTLVVQSEDDSSSLYIIVEGRVRVFCVNEAGKEFVFATVEAGDLFGEMVLDGGPRSASVITLEPCSFLVIPRHRVDELLAQFPEFAKHIIIKLIRTVRRLSGLTLDLAYQDMYGRLVRFLNDNAVPKGGNDGELALREPLTQAEIAARIGGSREQVNRIVNELCAGGYISVKGKTIEIHRRLPAKW